MIVQRTEKSITDITKHEIIAKFIMEAKAASNASRIPSIIAISESVKRICPELEAAIGRTVSHLEVSKFCCIVLFIIGIDENIYIYVQ